MDADNEDYWSPIRSLQYRLPVIVDRIEQLLQSQDPKSRDTAATILGQNGVKDKWEISRCGDRLLSAMKQETSSTVLSSLIHALGNLHDTRGIKAVLPFATHRDPEVRYAVVHCLNGHDNSHAVQAMIQLSSDPDRDVRNWATFGLGSQIETNTPAIRKALLARLDEEDAEIRGEAMVGLAERGDVGVVAPFLRELTTTDPDTLRNWTLAIDTAQAIIRFATETGAPSWLPVLEKLRSLHICEAPRIEAAIGRCTPGPK
jgi:HEAT repeat protein